MARTLFLHLSALSNAEYDAYTDALKDLLDDDDANSNNNNTTDDELETRAAALPVVRAWMKGRFRDLGGDVIDQVRFSYQ